jgi:glyoxylase-like metal-dependent hydrolase (beta-lactamase superfamily II)
MTMEISRRDIVFGAAAAYAAFGLDRPIAFIGAAHAQAPAEGFKKYKVGDIEVISLYDGVWEKAHDPNFIKGATVDETRAALKAGGLPDAFVPVTFTTIAVRTGGQLVLVDTGTGGGQAGGPKAGLLAKSMAAAGIDPKEARTIVISHFHADHVSGLMTRENQQTFPNAEIIVPTTELKFWTQPVDSIPEPRRKHAQRMQATLQAWKNVKPVDGEVEVAPGVRTIPAFGHTEGHTAHLISSGGQQLLATADATNVAALFVKNPEWVAAFDHVPDQAIETRRRLFDRAIANKMMVAGYHWGLPNVGTVQRDGKGYAFVPAS